MALWQALYRPSDHWPSASPPPVVSPSREARTWQSYRASPVGTLPLSGVMQIGTRREA